MCRGEGCGVGREGYRVRGEAQGTCTGRIGNYGWGTMGWQ